MVHVVVMVVVAVQALWRMLVHVVAHVLWLALHLHVLAEPVVLEVGLRNHVPGMHRLEGGGEREAGERVVSQCDQKNESNWE